MKPVLGWVKKNLVSVIAIVVALAALPTLSIVSSGWAKKQHQSVEQEVNKDLRDLNQISVTYEAPGLDPTARAVSFSRTPNAATTEAIKGWISAARAEVGRLEELAIERNQPDRRPLVEGLFPTPNPSESTQKRLEMARAWPDATRGLLHDVGAGSPPDPALVLDHFKNRFRAEQQRVLGVDAAQEKAELPPDELAQIRRVLGAERLGMYRARAEDIRFYADADAMPGVTAWDELRGAPSLELCWEWQWEYWIYGDVLRGLATANTDVAGQPFSAVSGPVKRLLTLSVKPWDLESAASSAQGKPPAGVSLAGEVRRDYEVSPTGRTAWPATPNPMFDVRYADVSLLADSSRLPQLFEAFPRAGLMSVVACSIEDYDPADDLSAGFYYGSDHLVRVTMKIETLWLRRWMAPMIPDSLRAAMGVPDSWAKPAPNPGHTPAEGSPAPDAAG